MPSAARSGLCAAGTHKLEYDAVIIGGAFAGCALALVIKRHAPDARVLIVERQPTHGRKVGEATVELSAFFLHHELSLYDYLSREHLPKHGLRYWFTDGPGRSLAQMSEIGPRELPRLPSFQLDRAKLDEHLLALATEAGCEVLRPAKVADVDFGWPLSTVDIDLGESGQAHGTRTVRARWVLDASGRRSLIARKLGLRRPVPAHPTTAMWARWEGVKDLDSEEVLGSGGIPRVAASRRLATNHFCGYGWWCWVIPLQSGQTSIGLVFNHGLMSPPDVRRPRERYEAFVKSQPGLRELLADATVCPDDFMMLKHVPYATEAYADKGWALIGDAASFMDPYYSPGLDHACISAYATARLVASDLNGDFGANADSPALAQAVHEHNSRFLRSFERWIGALYLDKYELFGDAELTACAYWLDTAGYFIGVVGPAYANTQALANPVFGQPIAQARWAYEIMRFFNRRLSALARARRDSGRYGARNVGWRCYTKSFDTGIRVVPALFRGLRLWMRLELQTMYDRLFVRQAKKRAEAPVSG